MPWREVTAVSQRQEFVVLAQDPGANIRELCRRFSISPRTGYRWLGRFKEQPSAELSDRSSRPIHSPSETNVERQAWLLALRDEFPYWGGRKLRAIIAEEGYVPEGQLGNIPSPSTITDILRRHGRLDSKLAEQAKAWQRFEHEAPNQLWQMDFKGHFAIVDSKSSRCHPLTILDDYSRFMLCLQACLNEQEGTVTESLKRTFRRYGLPLRITADNGSPWGCVPADGLTSIGVWLSLLGVRLSHSRPYHPQTQGKDERFHRTLNFELLTRNSFDSIPSTQVAFDTWRDQYNCIRPHEACGLQPPSSRYQVSPRPFPETLPVFEYDAGDIVRKVSSTGRISYKDRAYRVGTSLQGCYVALRPAEEDAVFDVLFCQQLVRKIHLINDQLP
jgi:transposase InsO family protein